MWLEREGFDDDVVYPNGISNGFPEDVQASIVRSIAGLENAVVLQWAYSIEYDYVDPSQLDERLECKVIPGLFLSGQINGTTGYEEAAVQVFV